MKTFLFLACAAFSLSLALNGCTDGPRQSASILSQNKPSGQPTYTPYYQGPQTGQNGQQKPQPGVASQPVASSVALQPTPQAKQTAAILLPLSGPHAALGQAMLNAAQQAVFDAAGTNFELQPRDTAGEGGAEEASRAAVAAGAKVIIGPVFAGDVPAVKRIAQASGIMVLPLSTDTSLAERGVFVMGLAPGAQVERVVSFASAQGAHRFAALIPSTPYGSLVDEVFRRAVSQQGDTLIDIQTYNPAGHDLAERIQTLAAEQDHIDAIFLPESDSELKKIADQLAAGGFSPSRTHVLGTGLWDVPGLGRQSSFLIGGWFAAPDPAQRRNFSVSYAAVYGSEPPRLATLAYDATALAAVLAKRGGRYDEMALTNPNGFAGLDGIFRLRSSGSVERTMAVLEVTEAGARVVDTAPTSFVMGGR